MEEMKTEADELCVRVRERLQDANSLSLDPNSINEIFQADKKLLDAKKLHPKNPDVPKLRKQLRSCFCELLGRIEDTNKPYKKEKSLKNLKDITFEGDGELEKMRKDFLIKLGVTPSQ